MMKTARKEEEDEMEVGVEVKEVKEELQCLAMEVQVVQLVCLGKEGRPGVGAWLWLKEEEKEH
jgi:hypothetical protein